MGVLDEHIDAMANAAREELRRQAELVLEAANRDVPIGDPADDPESRVGIIASGRVEIEHTPLTGRTLAHISYDTPYVVKQHESFHLRHPRGGGPRFLENAVIAHARGMETGLAAAIRATARTGRTRQRRS